MAERLHRVKVKICGITTVDDALLAVQYGADALGLNFYPRSPRCVTLTQAEKIREVVPPEVWCVGVFVNAPRSSVEEIASRLRLDAIQFHGDEQEKELKGWGRKVIRAFRLRGGELSPQVLACEADYLLVDAYQEGMYGGTGQTLAWDAIGALLRDRLILAGGLTPENVAQAVRAVRPFAVDVASGVETSPGKKDPHKLEVFISHAHTA
ncbi:MAG: phosphoribosylanthranilate isomerase [Deltaproteobacteria bacterium]|nr:phosphoribosylanthranilate isomerase [Deltaproteobacteria bacterium]